MTICLKRLHKDQIVRNKKNLKMLLNKFNRNRILDNEFYFSEEEINIKQTKSDQKLFHILNDRKAFQKTITHTVAQISGLSASSGPQ